MTSLLNIPNAIDIKVKATHFNYINKNFVLYTEDAVKKGVKSWITPFKKPQLIHHNEESDPIGRVSDYKIMKDTMSDGPNDYVELTVHITDKSAIEKILDGRYDTVSVGTRTRRVLCSECNQVLNDEGLCEHQKGSFNEDHKPIYWIVDQIEYKENSFVNVPADEYAGVSQINIGAGWVPYAQFLDNRVAILSEFELEDNIMENKDAKLSTPTRNKLPDSAFCYVVSKDGAKVRKFPAHDAAHVRNGLARVSQAKLPDSAKSKILACLRRRAKKYGIDVSSDTVQDDTADLVSEFTPEEIQAVDQLFTETPDFDELPTEEPKTPEVPIPATSDQIATEEDVTKMKKDDLITFVDKLKKQIEDNKAENKTSLELRDKKIKDLEDEVNKQETVILGKEDEINKLIDRNAVSEQKYRSSIISNIIDLKMTDNINDTKEVLEGKLKTRKIESLIDSLTDLRGLKNKKETSSTEDNKVVDPTIGAETLKDSEKQNNGGVKKENDKFAIFAKPRI